MHRFAISYFFLFASVGVFAPWLPPFLEHRGLSPRAIGLGLALVSLSRAVLPPVWGMLADRLHAKRTMFAITAALAGTSMAVLLIPGPPVRALLGLAVYGFFLVPVLPLIEVLTLESLGGDRTRYGPIRLWGSLGFIVTASLMGWVTRSFGLPTVPLAIGLPLVLAGAVALGFPEVRGARSAARRPVLRDMPWRVVLPLVLVAALGQGSHGPYYVFFTLQLTARHVDPVLIGGLWGLGVVAEIVLMAVSPRLLPRLGLIGAIRWALLLSVLRWSVLAGLDSLAVITVSQLLHAASYGLLHVACVQLCDQVSPEQSKALGQTLLSAGAYGVGIGGGLALAGHCVSTVGYSGLYAAAALASSAALLMSMALSRRAVARMGADDPRAAHRSTGEMSCS